MKLTNTGLTAFTLISSVCAGAEAGDSVTTATGRRKKVHLRGRGKATISDYANPPANPNAASANKQDKDKGVPSPSKSSIKTGYFENLPSFEEKYGKFVGKYAVCKNMYTVAEGDVNGITLSSKQFGSSPLLGGKASILRLQM